MEYCKFEKELLGQGYRRVERDDRLLDVLPGQTRGKGVELWDRWSKETVELVRILLPYRESVYGKYVLSRQKMEQALLRQEILNLEEERKS